MKKNISILGTRPEAIKMAAVVKELGRHPDWFQSLASVTARRRQMLDQVLNQFDICPDYDPNIIRLGQGLSVITSNLLQGLKATERCPEVVVAGTVVRGGTDREKIVSEAARLLINDHDCRMMGRVHNPYGDSAATARIMAILHARDGRC